MSQCMRLTDRQTDGWTGGQTDGRTEFSSLDRMQRGKHQSRNR